MVAPNSSSKIDIIATRILLETKEATQALSNFDKGVAGSTTNVEKLVVQMHQLRQATGNSIKKLVKDFKELNGQVGTGKFGALGANDKMIENAGELLQLYENQLKIMKAKTAEATKLAAQEQKQQAQAALPKNVIPQYVQKTFGDINSYIAQSQNKVEAWKSVVTRASKAAGTSFEATATQLKKMVGGGNTVQPLNQALRELNGTAKTTFQKIFDGANLLRTAFGVLTSMLIFQVMQAFTTVFTEASKQARQLEENVWRLANAERALSKEGVEISLKGMEDAIGRIQQKFKVFSREDITQLYSSIAVATKQLGLSEKQISSLTEAVVFLNIQSSKQEDLMSTQASTLSSLLGKNSQGLTQLGVSFKNEFIEQEAVRLGMIKLGQTTKDLTEEQIAHVKISLVAQAGYVDTAEGVKILNDFLETNSAKIQTNTATWKDFLAVVGQGINNLLPNAAPAIEELQKSFEVGGIQKLFGEAIKDDGIKKFALQNQIVWTKLSLGIKLTQKEYDKLKKSLEELSDKQILDIFPDPSSIKDRFVRELVQSLVDVKETATGLPDPLIPEVVDEKSLEALDDLEKKMQDILLDAKQAQEDLDLKLGQKQDDLDLEYERKGEDAARDHAQKLEDINQDALDKIEDAKRKAREDEKKAEQDLLQKLKELRQRFLLDLEDALRARDARQVLRLIKEYQLDKQNILDKKRLDDEERKDKLAADLAAIEIERQRRIESENIEYARKLSDLNAAKAREQEDLALWYKREQEDIQRNIEQKLQSLIAGYAQEYGLHEESQKKIYGLLLEYFGKDTELIGRLSQFMVDSATQMQQAVAGSLNNMLGLMQGVNPFAGALSQNAPLNLGLGLSGNTNPFANTPVSTYGFAEGGTLVAKRPTLALFGEKSPEIATFSPIGRTGKDANKVFGDISGNGTNGNLGLRISISDGLIAEIIESSMENVAVVIDHARRER